MIDLCFVDKRTPRQFRFESAWVEHADFPKIVKDGWAFSGAVRNEDRVWEIHKRLGGCRVKLSKWSSKVFPNNRKRIDSLMMELSLLRQGDIDDEKAMGIDRIKSEIEGYWELEEKYWSQRSRLKWLRFGDHNSKFFHAVTVQRRQMNKVARIRNDDGDWLENEGDIGDSFKVFYEELFTSSGPRDLSYALSYVQRKVTSEMNSDLLKPVSLQEVKIAAFQLGRDKAP